MACELESPLGSVWRAPIKRGGASLASRWPAIRARPVMEYWPREFATCESQRPTAMVANEPLATCPHCCPLRATDCLSVWSASRPARPCPPRRVGSGLSGRPVVATISPFEGLFLDHYAWRAGVHLWRPHSTLIATKSGGPAPLHSRLISSPAGLEWSSDWRSKGGESRDWSEMF